MGVAPSARVGEEDVDGVLLPPPLLPGGLPAWDATSRRRDAGIGTGQFVPPRAMAAGRRATSSPSGSSFIQQSNPPPIPRILASPNHASSAVGSTHPRASTPSQNPTSTTPGAPSEVDSAVGKSNRRRRRWNHWRRSSNRGGRELIVVPSTWLREEYGEASEGVGEQAEDEHGRRLDDDEIIDILIMYLNAGHESSGHITMWATVFLQENPDIFAKGQEQEATMRSIPPMQQGLTLRDSRKMEYLSQTLAEGAMIGHTPRGMQVAQETIEKMVSRNFFLNPRMGSDLLLAAAGERTGGYTTVNYVWDLLQSRNITPSLPAVEAYHKVEIKPMQMATLLLQRIIIPVE